jgi:hypothetical protein
MHRNVVIRKLYCDAIWCEIPCNYHERFIEWVKKGPIRVNSCSPRRSKRQIFGGPTLGVPKARFPSQRPASIHVLARVCGVAPDRPGSRGPARTLAVWTCQERARFGDKTGPDREQTA